MRRSELLKIIIYNRDTGEFKWLISPNRSVKVGDICGSKTSKNGYIYITFKGRKYLAHRLAWFYIYSSWPTEIDHINGNKKDNSLKNLREVSRRSNMRNNYRARNGNLTGASFIKREQKWQATAYINGKPKFLGYFNTEKEAHTKYLKCIGE